MTVVDTSVLIGSLTGGSGSGLRDAIERGERMLVPALVLYEWLRGPRVRAEIELQEALFPASAALPFTEAEAVVAARLYSELPRARGREVDLAIAAHALVRDAPLWTLNADDFADVPDLRLARS